MIASGLRCSPFPFAVENRHDRGSGDSVDDDGCDYDEGDDGPEPVRPGELSLLQRIGDVEQRADAPHSEEGDHSPLPRTGPPRSEADPAAGGPDDEDEPQ